MTEKKQVSSYQDKRNKKNAITRAFSEHGRVQPQATDLEEAVLGACLLEYNAYDTIGHILSPECFYKEVHQIIFKSIEGLSANNKPVDILTVVDYLKTEERLELVGGAFQITQLTNRVASTANIEYHAMIIYQKFIQREMIRLSSDIIKFSFEDNFEDSERSYNYATEIIDNLLAGKRADRSMYQIMQDHEKEVLRRIEMSDRGEITGIKTGIVHLNKYTNGFKPGELVIIAGRPGMGKTAVALNLFTKNAAKQNKKTLFFSLEMDDLSLSDRLSCSYGGINPDLLKSGKQKDEWFDNYINAKEQLEKLPIYIDDSARVNIKHITTVSRAKSRKDECDMVVVDYLQLIEVDQGYYNKNREREVAEMSRSLKLLAKELKVPVMLLCQLNRGVESRQTAQKRPMLGDLRESGAIEQDADMVIFPYRPEYYGITEDDHGNSTEGAMIMIIAKNRNGRTGDVYAKYSPDLTQFFDYDYHNESVDVPY